MTDNFLLPDINQIRHSIRDIDESYNNDWDLIAELCQNAIDAIRKSDIEVGKIEIDIDAPHKTIMIQDNGIGMNPDDMPILLKPFSTNKPSDDDTIGEKGVGLTYVMFSCNHFEILSGNVNGVSKGKILEAYNWKNKADNTVLALAHERVSDAFVGTKVLLKDVADSPLFNLTFEQLKFVLLTKTALGNTLSIWQDDRKIEILLKFRDQQGTMHEEAIPFKYWLVFRDLAEHEVINLDEFIDFASDAERSDIDKRKKLKDKIIYKKGQFVNQKDNRRINFIACFVPSRQTWDTLTMAAKLFTPEQLEDPEYLDTFGHARFHEGVTVSVKGMPTGISIERPSTGYAGYWSNIFILFEDRRIKFDIGRKSIHGMQAKLYKNYARQIFNDFLRYVTKYVTGEVNPDIEWDKDEAFADIEKIVDIGSNKITFRKTPKDQEASVAAIFYECIGRGIITDIVPLISGYKHKYDLYAKWNNKRAVLDFKSKLKNVLKDFSDQQKMFNQLDCIVCWNVDEEDKQAFADMAINLEKIEPNRLVNTPRVFPNSTHRLILTGFVEPIYVIDLKQILSV